MPDLPAYQDLAGLVARQAEQLAVQEKAIEDLTVRLAARDEQIERQRVQIEELTAEVADLKAQIGKNSRNSSKPPSSDGLDKPPAPKSLRGKSKRKPGGQSGHLGSTLRQVENPDRVIQHRPAACGGCGRNLESADVERVGMVRRQVFDIPEPRIEVVEHQLVKLRCGCGTITTGGQDSDDVPGDVPGAPVSYGPRAIATVIFLYVGHFVSKKRCAEAMAALFGLPMSTGTIETATTKAFAALSIDDGFLARVKARLAAGSVVHFDETGMRINGAGGWIHSASATDAVLLFAHAKRGTEAMDAAGVLPGFGGIAIHDAWAPYDTYTNIKAHQLCCAHILRELVAVAESGTGKDDPATAWASTAIDALMHLKKATDTASATGRKAIGKKLLAEQSRRFERAARAGISRNLNRQGKLAQKHHALAVRMRDRKADYLRFAHDLNVPFDNNEAERVIRMAKTKQKVSGSLRSTDGADRFCGIRSYLATAARHSKPALDTLIQLAQGKPWIPEYG